MARLLIGIHGLGNKPERKLLVEWWKAAIAEGLRVNCGVTPAFELHVVHWADLLYKHPLHRDPAFSFDSHFDHEPYVEAPPGALKRYRESWVDRVKSDVGEAASKGLQGARDALGLGHIAHFYIERKAKELHYYWDASRTLRDRNGNIRAVREVLNDECRRALLDRKGHQIMLLAHSMGSIIAYNVLRGLGTPDSGLRVSHFVTFGSPLGLAVVKDRVSQDSWDRQLRTPTIVTESWVNIADRRDSVALDRHLHDDYKANGAGVWVDDDLVFNDYHSPDGEPNPHKGYGYLRTPEMSDVIAGFLTSG